MKCYSFYKCNDNLKADSKVYFTVNSTDSSCWVCFFDVSLTCCVNISSHLLLRIEVLASNVGMSLFLNLPSISLIYLLLNQVNLLETCINCSQLHWSSLLVLFPTVVHSFLPGMINFSKLRHWGFFEDQSLQYLPIYKQIYQLTCINLFIFLIFILL